MEALKCPVCDGRQFVEIGFYGDGGVIAVNNEKCRSCDGKGYVLAPEAEPTRYVPMPYPVYPIYPAWPAWTTDRTPRRWFETTTPSITWSPNSTGTITVTTNPYEPTSACHMSNDGAIVQ